VPEGATRVADLAALRGVLTDSAYPEGAAS
jgi:hypothetical protein